MLREILARTVPIARRESNCRSNELVLPFFFVASLQAYALDPPPLKRERRFFYAAGELWWV